MDSWGPCSLLRQWWPGDLGQLPLSFCSYVYPEEMILDETIYSFHKACAKFHPFDGTVSVTLYQNVRIDLYLEKISQNKKNCLIKWATYFSLQTTTCAGLTLRSKMAQSSVISGASLVAAAVERAVTRQTVVAAARLATVNLVQETASAWGC